MDKAKGPLVSVIMPVYNGQAYIGDAIRSVLGQSYADLELLIINDGSDDNTEEIIFQTVGVDNRVRYFKQLNSGVSAARNVGLANMKGSYFSFLDADDVMEKESIESRLSKFSENKDLEFCDGGVTVYDDSLRFFRRQWKPSYNGFVFKKLVRLSSSCFFGPTWLIKRDFSTRYSFQEDMTHAEDLFFFVEISKMGVYDYVDENILLYRTSKSSAMRNVKGLAMGYTIFFRKIFEKFRNELTWYDKVNLWFKIRKIVTLSFLDSGYFLSAFHWLITGRIK